MVGFADGRLMLTKRGILFQRRNDAILYQNSKGTGGIEAIEWRGSLVAWANASGIKLFDVERMTDTNCSCGSTDRGSTSPVSHHFLAQTNHVL